MNAESHVQIVVPSNWWVLVNGARRQLECEASTVRHALDWLTARYPQFRVRLFSDAQDRVAAWINVYINEDNIRELEGLDTRINASATLTIIQTVAGG